MRDTPRRAAPLLVCALCLPPGPASAEISSAVLGILSTFAPGQMAEGPAPGAAKDQPAPPSNAVLSVAYGTGPDRQRVLELAVLERDLPNSSEAFRTALQKAGEGAHLLDDLLPRGGWAVARDMRGRRLNQRAEAPFVFVARAADGLVEVPIPAGHELSYDRANDQLSSRRQHTVRSGDRDQRVLDIVRYRADGRSSSARLLLGAEGGTFHSAHLRGSDVLRDLLSREELRGVEKGLGEANLTALRRFLDADPASLSVEISVNGGRVSFIFKRQQGKETRNMGVVIVEDGEALGRVPAPPEPARR